MNGNKIRRVLINLILGTIPPSISGKVKSVNENDFTCVVTPFDGGPDYEEVRLNVNIDSEDKGVVSIPQTGSDVLISPLFNSDRAYYISRFSKVIKWHLKTVSGSNLVFDDQGNVLINSGSFGGLVKIEQLVSKINKLEEDLNKHKQVVAGIIALGASAPGTPVTNGTLAAFFNTPPLVYPTIPFTPTTKLELENTKVKHG